MCCHAVSRSHARPFSGPACVDNEDGTQLGIGIISVAFLLPSYLKPRTSASTRSPPYPQLLLLAGRRPPQNFLTLAAHLARTRADVSGSSNSGREIEFRSEQRDRV